MGRNAILLALIVGAAPACARTACAASPPDQPVPASEPRATLVVELDLPRAQNCDERFDLALYQDRGVELVSWDSAPQRCHARRATIRYLPKRLVRAQLIETVQKNALAAKVIEG